MLNKISNFYVLLIKRDSKIPKGQTKIFQINDRQDHDQQNETKDKHKTLKTKAGVTRNLQK